MKRYGKYYEQYNGLFDAYQAVRGVNTIVEDTHVVSPKKNNRSFPGIKFVKIFTQRKGLGADLTHVGKVENVLSDDGVGSTVMTAVDNDKKLQIVATNNNTQVRVVDSSGRVEDEFVTTVPARYDDEKFSMSIINIQEL